MRRVREILRLKHECGASDRAIDRSLGIARNTVALTLDRVAAARLAARAERSAPILALVRDQLSDEERAMVSLRKRVLDGTRRATFVRWYLGLAANDEDGSTLAAAA